MSEDDRRLIRYRQLGATPSRDSIEDSCRKLLRAPRSTPCLQGYYRLFPSSSSKPSTAYFIPFGNTITSPQYESESFGPSIFLMQPPPGFGQFLSVFPAEAYSVPVKQEEDSQQSGRPASRPPDSGQTMANNNDSNYANYKGNVGPSSTTRNVNHQPNNEELENLPECCRNLNALIRNKYVTGSSSGKSEGSNWARDQRNQGGQGQGAPPSGGGGYNSWGPSSPGQQAQSGPMPGTMQANPVSSYGSAPRNAQQNATEVKCECPPNARPPSSYDPAPKQKITQGPNAAYSQHPMQPPPRPGYAMYPGTAYPRPYSSPGRPSPPQQNAYGPYPRQYTYAAQRIAPPYSAAGQQPKTYTYPSRPFPAQYPPQRPRPITPTHPSPPLYSGIPPYSSQQLRSAQPFSEPAPRSYGSDTWQYYPASGGHGQCSKQQVCSEESEGLKEIPDCEGKYYVTGGKIKFDPPLDLSKSCLYEVTQPPDDVGDAAESVEHLPETDKCVQTPAEWFTDPGGVGVQTPCGWHGGPTVNTPLTPLDFCSSSCPTSKDLGHPRKKRKKLCCTTCKENIKSQMKDAAKGGQKDDDGKEGRKGILKDASKDALNDGPKDDQKDASKDGPKDEEKDAPSVAVPVTDAVASGGQPKEDDTQKNSTPDDSPPADDQPNPPPGGIPTIMVTDVDDPQGHGEDAEKKNAPPISEPKEPDKKRRSACRKRSKA